MKRVRARKFAGLALVVVATAVGLPSLAGAAPDDVQGPACADVIDGGGAYAGSDLSFVILVAAPSCKNVTYTVIALDSAGDTTVVGTASKTGDGHPDQVVLRAPITDDDNNICVYVVTTAGHGPHVFDRAPDEGCLNLDKDAGGGLGGMN